MLGHDWASPEATYHSYELFARKVIPHFKGHLSAPRASHEWAKGKRDELLGRAGEAIVKAIGEHTDEQLHAPAGRREAALMRAAVLRDGAMVCATTCPNPCRAPARCSSR